MFKDLERLVALNTANMDEEKKLTAINVLKEMFSFAQTSIVLSARGATQAILLGINCDLNQIDEGIVFSGHIDTVPIRNDYCIDNDLFYGRGTSDMKAFFPCLKKVFQAIDLSSITLPIVVAVSFDEETNNKGISAISDYFVQNKLNPNYCIVGEPTSSSCALSNYGCYDIIVSIVGVEGHIINEDKRSGFDTLFEVLCFLNAIKQKYSQTIIKTTFVHGGEESNVLPAECKLGFQVRTMDFKNVLSICGDLETILNEDSNSASVNICDTNLPPFQNYDSCLAKIVCKHNGARNCDFPATTEAGVLQNLNIDTVICGPGDFQTAHTSYEHISCLDMEKYVALLTKVVKELNNKMDN